MVFTIFNHRLYSSLEITKFIIYFFVEATASGSSASASTSTQSSVRSFSPFFRKAALYANTSRRKLELDKSLLLMIAADFQPFSIVKYAGFRQFVHLLDVQYSLPNSDTRAMFGFLRL